MHNISNQLMTEYYIIRDRIEDLYKYLEETIHPVILNVVKNHIDRFSNQLDQVIEKIIENPEYAELGRREIMDHAETLHRLATPISVGEVDLTVIEKIHMAIQLYIINILPNIHVKSAISPTRYLEELLNEIRVAIRHHSDQVKNLTRYTLTEVLHNWCRSRRLLVMDIDSVYNDVATFINLVHNQIDIMLEGSQSYSRIESYMSRYNDVLFDVLTNRDPDLDERFDIRSLDDQMLDLLSEMRWIDAPTDMPNCITSDINSICGNQSGIKLSDVISNYNSLEVNEVLRERLESIIESLNDYDK